MHALEIFGLPHLIQSTVCSQDPEQHASDGWEGSKRLSVLTQYELTCKTTQQVRLRTRQANGWKTNCPAPRHLRILLHWVFQRLKVLIGDKRLPFPLTFWSFPLPICWMKSLPSPFSGWYVRNTTFLKAFVPL